MAATSPGWITPFAVLISWSVTHLSHVVVISSSSIPTACAIIGTVAPHAMVRISGCSSIARYSGGRRRGPVVDQGIGFQVDEDLDIVRGRHADGVDSADLPDVLSHLRRSADADAHQLERRVPEDLGDHHPADEPGAPDHDSPGHVAPLSWSAGSKTHSRASSSGMKGRSGPFSTRNPVITALEAQEAPVNETDERLTLP